MKLTKRQLKRIIREEYSRIKRRGLIRESRDDFPVVDRSRGVDIEDLAHGRGDYAPSADADRRSKIEPRMLDAFIEKMLYEDMTPEEFMNYFGNQDGYMYHGAHWKRLKGEYLEAMRDA